MRHEKEKRDDSQDQFEEMKEEVETLNARRVDSPPKNNIKNHPRMQYMAEKHKLGLITPAQPTQITQNIQHRKQSQAPLGKIIKVGSATFRSNFESGSIGSVNLIGANSFKISLDNETNSTRGNTWFDFIVEDVKGEASFTITGFKKKSSLYNEGMKLCYRQIGENKKWKRGGTQISYIKDITEDENSKTFEIKFNFTFKNDHDIEFAYCFPYGYSRLQQLLTYVHNKAKIQTFASSFEGKDIPLINIGNLSSKEVIVLSARVHPGETVSSLMMEGFIKEIVSDSESARYLRQRFLFKIIPMINVDGVRHGNFRFSALGVDLNRRWDNPLEQHHPEIYYLKQMMLRENKNKKIRMFIDMHGHSRKKNVFFYGCCEEKEQLIDCFQPKAFPFLMSKIHDAFSYNDCNFTVQPDKEGTARIAIYKQLRIHEIYTLQASFCSSAKGSNYLQSDYQKMGQKLCEGISLYFYESNPKNYNQLSKLVQFREKIYEQLKGNPILLKQGNQQSTGSDSQPQKGEIGSQQKGKHSHQYLHDAPKIVIRQETTERPMRQPHQTSAKTPMNSLHLQQLSLKHKSQADANSQRQKIEISTANELFPPIIKLGTIKTDYDLETIPPQKNIDKSIEAKHIRVHIPTKGSTVPVSKLSLYGKEESPNQQESNKISQKKVERKAQTPFETTQYRRIKNMAEQKNSTRRTNPTPTPPTDTPQKLIQSINTRKIEVQPPQRQGVVPRFYAQTPFRRRKNSVQVFYSKANKSMVKPPKDTPNVFCRGKQIMF